MKPVRAVFHIDELDKWPLVLANIRNLVRAVDMTMAEIVVMANSKAVSVFDGSVGQEHHAAIAEAANAGVVVSVCQNSLDGLHIGNEQLPEFVVVVPVGVLALIERQSVGFAYIKP